MVIGTYTKPRKAYWSFKILPPFWGGYKPGLVEEAPLNEKTRDNYKLVDPILEFLGSCEHKLVVDRGDFGEGDEVFHVRIDDASHAEQFQQLINKLISASKCI